MRASRAKLFSVQAPSNPHFLPVAWLAFRRTVYRRRFVYGLGLGWALAFLINTIFVLKFPALSMDGSIAPRELYLTHLRTYSLDTEDIRQ
jgi:hypothetical protein